MKKSALRIKNFNESKQERKRRKQYWKPRVEINRKNDTHTQTKLVEKTKTENVFNEIWVADHISSARVRAHTHTQKKNKQTNKTTHEFNAKIPRNSTLKTRKSRPKKFTIQMINNVKNLPRKRKEYHEHGVSTIRRNTKPIYSNFNLTWDNHEN